MTLKRLLTQSGSPTVMSCWMALVLASWCIPSPCHWGGFACLGWTHRVPFPWRTPGETEGYLCWSSCFLCLHVCDLNDTQILKMASLCTRDIAWENRKNSTPRKISKVEHPEDEGALMPSRILAHKQLSSTQAVGTVGEAWEGHCNFLFSWLSILFLCAFLLSVYFQEDIVFRTKKDVQMKLLVRIKRMGESCRVCTGEERLNCTCMQCSCVAGAACSVTFLIISF